MHPDVEEAIDQIDAAVFSGDTFMDPTSRATLREMMARWERGLVSFDQLDEDL
jgi:hypothetical protein